MYEPGDISSEGNLVVGRASNNDFIYPPHQVAVLWRPWTGIEKLNDTYADLLQDGSSLSTASAVSPDGRYIVGQGYNAATGRNEAYLLDTGISTAVEEAAPVAVRLVSLWPNPFREAAHMRFQVAVPGRVRLVVYDLLGRSVRTLLEGPLAPGMHEVVWDGRSDAGVRLPAGLYLLRLEADGQTQTRTITIVR
ncbi:FlgD immunoglobulin-like domain containing protein [Rhodothermus marinus]|uniref:FlgD immunoglobulin-like domain containing protein n=1 Tax=Rhodothermus marinus TaxID=29549 RepID=UPI001FB5548B|nr:FlgD immunoglobulin-like domain containing protein [Rhodothermus marinus]